MAGGICRASQLALASQLNHLPAPLAVLMAALPSLQRQPAHPKQVQQLNSPSVEFLGCFSEGVLKCSGMLRPCRSSGGGKGCPGAQVGTAGASPVTQILVFGSGMECQVSTISRKNYALEMPLSVGQSLEGQLRLDFQLLAGEMNSTL